LAVGRIGARRADHRSAQQRALIGRVARNGRFASAADGGNRSGVVRPGIVRSRGCRPLPACGILP
jgi:hypothetical protein